MKAADFKKLDPEEQKRYYELFVHAKRPRKQVHHRWVDPKDKDSAFQHNSSCEICFQFVTLSTAVLRCRYCNVVCHINCLQKLNSGAYFDDGDWVCFYCQDSLDYDRSLHDKITFVENYQNLLDRSQTIVATAWRRSNKRRWYIRIYSSIVRMQIQFQVRKRKRQFLYSVQAKLRTIKLKVSSISQLGLFDREAKVVSNPILPSTSGKVKKRDYTIYFIVNVYDLTQGNSIQTWRIESPMVDISVLPNTLPDILLEEKVIIGGVSGFQHLVISIFQKGVIRDIFLGQAAVELSANNCWKRGGKFSQNLVSCGYELKDAAGMDLKADFHLVPKGSISFEIVTAHGMTSECCACYATAPEDIVRSLAKLPDSTGYILPVKKITGRAMGAVAKGGNSPSAVSVAHSVAPSVAGSNLGGSGNVQLEGNSGMKKVWIAITEGKLYVFGHFGDSLKLTVDLQHFSISFDFSKNGKNIIYKCYRMGYPEFQFYPVLENEIFRVKCAFLSTLRCAKGFAISGAHTHSPYTGVKSPASEGNGSHEQVQLPPAGSIGDKFDANYLVGDLLALEMLKTKKTALKEAASPGFSSSPMSSKNHGLRASQSEKLVSSPMIRNSVQLSPISKSISKSMSKSSANLLGKGGKGEGTRRSQPGIDLPPVEQSSSPITRTSLFSSPVPEEEDDLKPVDPDSIGSQKRGRKGPIRGSMLKSSLNEKALKALTNAQKEYYQSITSSVEKKKEETREEIKSKLIEEITIDELATEQKYQNVGEMFIKNLITDVTEQKIMTHFARDRGKSMDNREVE